MKESITVDIEVGDTILGGKFLNKKVEVKEIGENERGEPTINGKPLLRYRIPKKEIKAEEYFRNIKIPLVFREELPKGAKSVKSPADVPKGWSVITGPRGGKYAVPGDSGKGGSEEEPKQDSIKLINDKFKKATKGDELADSIWKKYEKGEITEDERKQQINEIKHDIWKQQIEDIKDILNTHISPPKDLKFGISNSWLQSLVDEGKAKKIEMSPDDFFHYAPIVDTQPDGHKSSVLSIKNLYKLFNEIIKNKRIDTGELEIQHGRVINHEGRHRMAIAKIFGIKMPVIIHGDVKGFNKNTEPQYEELT